MLSLVDDTAGTLSRNPIWSDTLEVLSLSCGYSDARTDLTGQLSLAMTKADLSALSRAQSDFLSPAEAQALAAMKLDRRRTSFLRGRAAAKMALCKAFGGAPTKWDIRSGVFNQPVAAYRGGEKPPVHVSISHSNEAGVAVSSPQEWPVAIDIETVSAQNRAALESQLTAREREWCENAPCALDAATALWTLKEAASKILGGGLALDFKALETVPSLSGDTVNCTFVNAGHLAGEAVPKDGVVLALVMSSQSVLTDSTFLSRAANMLSSSLGARNICGEAQP